MFASPRHLLDIQVIQVLREKEIHGQEAAGDTVPSGKRSVTVLVRKRRNHSDRLVDVGILQRMDCALQRALWGKFRELRGNGRWGQIGAKQSLGGGGKMRKIPDDLKVWALLG